MTMSTAIRRSEIRSITLYVCAMVMASMMPVPGHAQVPSNSNGIVKIYSDTGTWEQGIIALENMLRWKGLESRRILRGDINSGDFARDCAVVVFPGGYSGDYSTAINAAGNRALRGYTENGGAYFGICAGAYYAAGIIEWEGARYFGELDLFEGTASGALNDIAPWPEYALTDISLNPAHPVNRYQQHRLRVMYFGGPSFHPNGRIAVDTIATWTELGNQAAIISFQYGSGRVLLCGPHPEIEEGDSRDGTLFGSELNDTESDWGLLWSAFDWLLGATITDTTTVTRLNEPARAVDMTARLNLYPNPAHRWVVTDLWELERSAESTITIYMHDLLGRCIMKQVKTIHGSGNVRLDLNGVSEGKYILTVHSASGIRGGVLLVGLGN